VVQFYGDDQELAASVGSYLGEGLVAGDYAVVVATLPHRVAFEAELAGAGIDVTAAVAAGRLVVRDAAQTLQGFWAGDQLDRDRFEAMAGSLLGPAADAGQPVRIYAEMVALLWDAGQVAAAIELEALWNDLGSRLPFSLLCGYPARLVTGGADAGAMAAVCRLHMGVIGPYPGLPPGAAGPAQGAGAARSFPQALDSARAARHFVLDALGPREDHAVAMDAAIIIAELAANAVLHARSGFTVAVSRSAASVRISVRDAAPVPMAHGCASLAVSHGHGLWVVDQVADTWAVEPLPDGKVVWADLPVSPQ
jgi:anti-sigma regulatory factor (Ser/Thr protein kinase)